METDEIHPDGDENGGPADMTFTVEVRVDSEVYAEALAVWLAAMGLTVWIKQLDITPEQGDDYIT